jgi:hypothetical protein
MVKRVGLLAVLLLSFCVTPSLAETFVEKMTSGKKLHCEAKDRASGQTWKCIFVMSKYDPDTGNFTGDLAWPSLDSLHHISGKFTGTKMTFREDRKIKAGSANMGTYVMPTFNEAGAGGTFKDSGGYSGTMKIFNNK